MTKKPGTNRAKVAREATARWYEAVVAWQRLLPEIIGRADGTRYMLGDPFSGGFKSPAEMSEEERAAAGWMLSGRSWKPGPNAKPLPFPGKHTDDDRRAAGWVSEPSWFQKPRPSVHAAGEMLAATHALVVIGAAAGVAADVAPLQRLRDKLQTPWPTLAQVDLLRDALHIAEQIELRFPPPATGRVRPRQKEKVLKALVNEPHLSPTQLADKVGCDRGNIYDMRFDLDDGHGERTLEEVRAEIVRQRTGLHGRHDGIDPVDDRQPDHTVGGKWNRAGKSRQAPKR